MPVATREARPLIGYAGCYARLSSDTTMPNAIQLSLQQQLEQQLGSAVASLQAVGGGCIGQSYRLGLADGRSLFLKTHDKPPTAFFEAEAAGLQALAQGGMATPAVLAVGEHHLVLSWIEPGSGSADGQYRLGQQLATLHQTEMSCFGFEHDTYCGSSRQPNRKTADGHSFFAEQRLLYQGIKARQAGLLSQPDYVRLEQICGRLPQWIPDQPAALLHGDLWSGNFMIDRDNRPWLIDPACYWGWPEADLAMTRMFGGFQQEFYRGYQSVNAIEPGFEQRIDLYNLYHWLNHLNLFGRSYLAEVKLILQRFS
ncbi:fructosamine kinase family protein [Marinobacterium arenosum]|uniref:fructosamine kinase family protein n=1 Tax=Marinobacterium arenosum TaxID=2862496 RepID=UPI001C989EBF|nr:fructosamine kinase family protein [Marinobacterium arenosum]MBY4679097.1 fructosamine kinase family protein [Marinobacterium arenosum]